MIANPICVLNLLALGGVLWVLAPTRRVTDGTTLGTAWRWMLGAAVAWFAAALFEALAGPVAPATAHAWYAASVLALCPWIAVLGARRPVVRVWNWFVLAPLAAVLMWPVAVCWMPRGPTHPPLETPTLIGFGVVSVMGFGNYLGTRFALSAALSAAAVWMALMSTSRGAGSGEGLRSLACLALLAAAMLAVRRAPRVPTAAFAWDRVWRDVRDTFGMVWANRLTERVNAQAARDGWTSRLTPDGFVAADPARPADLERDLPRIDHTSRWLLQRFVDDAWIDARLSRGDDA
ncbi:MAG: hypothetical protein KF774_12170 [Planctomyces sp.]|nr:hypothetical protein [Planctomyces sp.]